jgi:hypothetical protein
LHVRSRCNVDYAAADDEEETALDSIYYCEDPSSSTNLIPCDETTLQWQLDALNADQNPDDSQVCQELITILVQAKQQEQIEQQEGSSQCDEVSFYD